MAAMGREGVRPAADHQRLFPDERQSPAAAHQGGLPLPIPPLRYSSLYLYEFLGDIRSVFQAGKTGDISEKFYK